MTQRLQIGIILCPDIPRQTMPAPKFLLLQLNGLQTAFEYQFVPCTDDQLLLLLTSSATVNRQDTENELERFRQRYTAYLTQLTAGYELGPNDVDKYIIISRARFADRYYMTGIDGVSVLALGYWDRLMAPPSLVESILTLVLKSSLSELRDIPFASHLGTKGCIFDFNADLSNARFAALQGFVCSQCQEKLDSAGHTKLAQEVQRILSKKWLGKITNPNSPASIAAKLGYNLFVATGLSPRWSERLMSALREDGVKELIRIVGGVVLAVLLVFLGIKEFARPSPSSESRPSQSPTPTPTVIPHPSA